MFVMVMMVLWDGLWQWGVKVRCHGRYNSNNSDDANASNYFW